MQPKRVLNLKESTGLINQLRDAYLSNKWYFSLVLFFLDGTFHVDDYQDILDINYTIRKANTYGNFCVGYHHNKNTVEFIDCLKGIHYSVYHDSIEETIKELRPNYILSTSELHKDILKICKENKIRIII